MKIIVKNYPFLLLLIVINVRCNLVSLDDPIITGQEIKSISDGPKTIPDDIDVYNSYLHNNDKKEYNNYAFTIASLNGFQDCRLDDKIIMSSDHTYSYDGGKILCGAEDSQQFRKGTWETIDNGKYLVFDKGTIMEYKAKVTGLNESQIVLEGSYLGLLIKGIYEID